MKGKKKADMLKQTNGISVHLLQIHDLLFTSLNLSLGFRNLEEIRRHHVMYANISAGLSLKL